MELNFYLILFALIVLLNVNILSIVECQGLRSIYEAVADSNEKEKFIDKKVQVEGYFFITYRERENQSAKTATWKIVMMYV